MLRRSFLSLALAGTAATRLSAEPAFKQQTNAPKIRRRERLMATRILGGLEHPWGIAVLPGGGYLVTERPGRLNHVGADGSVTRIAGAPEVSVAGQGGMLDIAVAPDFAETRRVFLTYSKPMRGGTSGTAAGWGVLDASNSRLEGYRDIFEQTPGVRGAAHFGSRIVPDGNQVFVTTGDRNSWPHVQDLGSTIGKVVRLNLDGSAPSSNPFVGQAGAMDGIWSYGHRNVQGAALHPETGELWTLEHGPKGGDELNRALPGQNYGWPLVSYGDNYDDTPVGEGLSSGEGITEPRYYWTPSIAPGGFTFYTGQMFDGWQNDVVAAVLRDRGIVRLQLDGDRVVAQAHYLRDLGRIRDVAVDRDGALLLLSDDPNGGIIRVVPG